MKIVKYKVLVILMVLFSLLPLGCWDYQEIDETAFVLVLGLDKGKENKLTVTAQIAVPRNLGGSALSGMGGAGGQTETTEVVSVEAPTFSAALNMMNAFVNRRISLKHVKSVVFSEELAREGTLTYLAVIGRFPEFRRSVFIAVARGISARELLESNKPVFESNPAKYVELATLAARFTAFSPLQPQFHYFYNAAHSQGADPVGILVATKRQTPQGEGPPLQGTWRSEGDYYSGELPRTGGNTPELIGAALFKGDILVGEINGDEMTGLMILRNTFEQAFVSTPDPLEPELMTAVNVHMYTAPTIKIDVSEPIPKIYIKVMLEGDVLGIQSHSNFEDPRFRYLLENALAQRIKLDIIKLLQKTQDLGVDSAWLGKKAKKHFLTTKQWEDYHWKEVFPQAPIEVEVIVNLRRFGLMRESAPHPQ